MSTSSGLELDQEQRPRFDMPRNQVDNPPFAEVAERHLGSDIPALVNQHSGDRLTHRRVATAEEPVQPGATPPWFQDETHFQHPRHSSECRDLDSLDLTTLDTRVRRRRGSRPERDVCGAPAKPNSKFAEDAADREVVHRGDLDACRLRANHRRASTNCVVVSCSAGAQPPAWARSTNWPWPRVPTNEPSRMTGRPRTKTERIAPESLKPSNGV